MVVALPAARSRPELTAFLAINAAIVILVGLPGAAGWAAVLLLAVAVPLAVALVRRPQRGLLALAALVPFNGLLILFPHPSILNGWKEGIMLAILLATFIAPAGARAPREGRCPVGRRPSPASLRWRWRRASSSVGRRP